MDSRWPIICFASFFAFRHVLPHWPYIIWTRGCLFLASPCASTRWPFVQQSPPPLTDDNSTHKKKRTINFKKPKQLTPSIFFFFEQNAKKRARHTGDQRRLRGSQACCRTHLRHACATPQEGSLRLRSGLSQQSKERHGLGSHPGKPRLPNTPALAHAARWWPSTSVGRPCEGGGAAGTSEAQSDKTSCWEWLKEPIQVLDRSETSVILNKCGPHVTFCLFWTTSPY